MGSLFSMILSAGLVPHPHGIQRCSATSGAGELNPAASSRLHQGTAVCPAVCLHAVRGLQEQHQPSIGVQTSCPRLG